MEEDFRRKRGKFSTVFLKEHFYDKFVHTNVILAATLTKGIGYKGGEK